MSVAHQAAIDWYAPRQEWNPIHARVDTSSEWYAHQLERAKKVEANSIDDGVPPEHSQNGVVAEAVVLNVFPHMERFDGIDSDLHGYGNVFDVCSGAIRVEPSPHYEIIVKGHRKREKATAGLEYYAVRVNHPDYYLIGHTNSLRFWHLADDTPGDHSRRSEYYDDGASLGFEHFKQLPVPDDFSHLPPAIDVFGQG